MLRNRSTSPGIRTQNQTSHGYRVYFGTGSDNYTQTMEVATPSATVPDLTEGVVYYFAVTAYNTEGVKAATRTSFIRCPNPDANANPDSAVDSICNSPI